MLKRLLFISVLSIVGTNPAQAQQAMDLVKEDALGTIATANLDQMLKNGSRYSEEVLGQRYDLSALFRMVLGYIKVSTEDLDFNGSAAVMQYKDLKESNDGLVIALPLKKGKYEEGKEWIEKAGDVPTRARYVRGGHLYVGSKPKVVKAIGDSVSIAPKLDPAVTKKLGSAGLLMHMNLESLSEKERRAGIQWMHKEWIEKFKGARQREVADALLQAAGELQHGFAWIRFEDRLHLRLSAIFDKQGPAAKKLLAMFRTDKQQASFTGLPEGNVIAAHSSIGGGGKGAATLNVFLQIILKMLPTFRQIDNGWQQYVDVITELAGHLDGGRFALYRTRSENGLFGVVGILDTENAERFLAEIKLLSRLGQGLDLTDPRERQKYLKLIDKLIVELGDEDYRTRESASVKLRLVGAPAVSKLKDASSGRDLERVRRAERLIEAIARDAKQQREALLKPGNLLNVRPRFVFLDKKEKLAGCDVYHVGVDLRGRDRVGDAKLLRTYLGADWNRIRVAVQGKKVVVLVGSQVDLLEQALVNLKEDKPGLAGQAEFKQADNTSAHTWFAISMSQIVDLIKGAEIGKPKGDLKSNVLLELAARGNRLEVDVHVPINEVRAIRELQQLMRKVK